MNRPWILASLTVALTFVAPVRGDEPPTSASNVIVVTLDGFRPQEFFGGADETLINPKAGGVADVAGLKQQFWRETPEARREALLPFLWGTVARQGQVFGDAAKKSPAKVTNGKKFSYPGYSEMFCGFPDDRIDSNAKKPNPNGSVLEVLDALPAYHGRVAAFCTWDVFPSIFRSETNGLKVHSGWTPIVDEPLTERQAMANLWLDRLPHYWGDNVYDVVTMEAAREHLIRHKPRVLFIGLGETDEWAHGRRYDLYLQSAYKADRYLADLWQTLQALPEYAGKTSILVTTDHGRGSTTTDWTSHGEKIDGAEDVWIAVMGAGVPYQGVREGTVATQSQVASSVAAILGEDFVARSPRSAPPLSGVTTNPPKR